jgi:hypothetical protein
MLKNANGGEGINNKDSQQLIKLIKDTGFEQFYDLSSREQIICQQPVIVKTVAADSGSATVAFPSDPTYETKIYFTNCTGASLTTNQKVYLQHKFDNPSQGWLVSNNSTYKIGSLTNFSSAYSATTSVVRQVGNMVEISASITTGESAAFPDNQYARICTLSGVSIPQGYNAGVVPIVGGSFGSTVTSVFADATLQGTPSNTYFTAGDLYIFTRILGKTSGDGVTSVNFNLVYIV